MSSGRIDAHRHASSRLVPEVGDGGLVAIEHTVTAPADLLAVGARRTSQSVLPIGFALGPESPSVASQHSTSEPPLQRHLSTQALEAHTQPYREHLWTLEVLAEHFQSSGIDIEDVSKSAGLSSAAATAILAKVGPNVLTPPAKIPHWLLFLIQFSNLFMVLLMCAGSLCLILYGISPTDPSNLYLGVLLWVVVFATCLETFYQEAKSDELMAKFRLLSPLSASVQRNGGQVLAVSALDLVPGDLVHLSSGQKIPADCRVLVTNGLKVDQSMITGESDPVECETSAADFEVTESRTIVFNGSLCVEGSGLVLVIRTGDHTLIGGMVALTGQTKPKQSTLKQDIQHFVTVVVVIALAQACIVFVVGLSRGLPPIQVAVNGIITVVVGNVPQGLPTTVTACLVIVAERMSKRQVLVKRLDIIECLGSCTCICTDKTGTLTQNLMSVANFWTFAGHWSLRQAGDAFSLAAGGIGVGGGGGGGVGAGVEDSETKDAATSGSSSSSRGSVVVESRLRALRCVVDICALNSRVVMMQSSAGSADSEPSGDATELGLYRAMGQLVPRSAGGIGLEQHRAAKPKVHEVPFNSKNKWQMSIHSIAADGGGKQQFVMFIKGAPDVLLGKCRLCLGPDGAVEVMGLSELATIHTAMETYAEQAERVLGLAMVELPQSVVLEEESDTEWKAALRAGLESSSGNSDSAGVAAILQRIVFVGLVTLQDPPRDEVPNAIEDCRKAGIKVVMVTGDHPVTAEAIARKIGLITLPTRASLARERDCDPLDVSESEVGALVVRGIDIKSMTAEDWRIITSKQEVVFARTSPENKLTIVNEFKKVGNITAMTGDGVNDSPALKQADIGIAMGLNGSDVAREAGDLVLLDDNFASIVVGIREGRLLFANLKKSVAYTLTHLVPEILPVLLWVFGGLPLAMSPILALLVDLLTELAPASSLAFEPAEEVLMLVPPRNAKLERLTSMPLLLYSYTQAGLILTGAALVGYFLQFAAFGVTAIDLAANANQFFPSANGAPFISASTGVVLTADDQLYILAVVQSLWYLSIVTGQASHIFACRTTVVSIFRHGVFGNVWVNAAVVAALGLACLVVYCPGVIVVTRTETPTQVLVLYTALVALAGLWSWSEFRKWVTRRLVRQGHAKGQFNRIFAW